MNKPLIKFLNHSSFLVCYKETKILCDPWFFGSAFQNGWSLLYDKSHDINNIDFDYIWISHEHPDHFSIPTLKSLNKSTNFIFQKTEDKKVINYLKKIGHQVFEIEDKKKIKVGDINIIVFVCDGYDSSIFFEFEKEYSFLNINDARVNLHNHIDNEIMPFLSKKKVDLVHFQFSYANWAGNKGDVQISKDQQELVNKKNIEIINKLNPRRFILAASFIYFCHEENFYWNDNFYLRETYELLKNIKKESKVIVPSPNQKIILSDDIDDFDLANNKALDFWTELHKSAKIKFRTKPVNDINFLKESYFRFFKKIYSNNEIIKTLDNKINSTNFELIIYIYDKKILIKISLIKKSFECSKNIISDEKDYDISITSETFVFLMENDFARGTLTINSRIIFNYSKAHKFFIFFFIPYSNNINKYYFDKKSLISDLASIKNTSIMQSILKFDTNLYNIIDSELNF
tara:strand:- start:2310 stop:3689 length:1380 start_codon:yes stop_codon:yes gene_type:complete